jgi:hypothetical protein
MSAGKKSSAKAASKNPAMAESSGNWIYSNVWFKIGLPRETAAMLKTIRQRIYVNPAKTTSAETLRLILWVALAHYDVLEPLMLRCCNYADAEGFSRTDVYIKELIDRQHLKINH